MEQQQQQQQSHAAAQSHAASSDASAKPRAFADIALPDEEEDDDPDFMPLAAAVDGTMPSGSAWTRAIEEVVGLHSSPVSSPVYGSQDLTLDVTQSPSKGTRAQKRLERLGMGGPAGMMDAPAALAPHATDLFAPLPAATDENAVPRGSPPKARPGRTRIYTAEEAAERKRARNRTYAKKQRLKRKRERLGLDAADDEDDSGADTSAPLAAQAQPPEAEQRAPLQDEMLLDAENRFLRAEVERLQEENARLRGREQMRMYVAQMRRHKERDSDAWLDTALERRRPLA